MSDHGGISRPILFGEVLFDHFPDGRAVLGGAPFNVAWHLQGFGLSPLLITRVGEDVPGEWVLDAMRQWGLDTRGVQQDPGHATGSVQVWLQGSEPQFRILGDQAYDHIAAGPALALAAENKATLFYHGTLAARSPISRESLRQLRAAVEAPVFMDANLREPWWEPKAVEELLDDTTWVKFNQEELAQFADLPPVQAAADLIRWRHRVAQVLVTAGPEGAWRFDGERALFVPAAEAAPLVNTVGAGDAFSAVCILGIAAGWPAEETLRRANEFAAFICTQPGAVCKEQAAYQLMRQRWLA